MAYKSPGSTQDFETKMDSLVNKFPLIFPTIEKLNDHTIPWMTSGSACLFLLGNDRWPGDFDVFLPDENHDQVDKLFKCTSFTFTSEFERARNSHPQDNHSIQFTSHVVLTVAGKEYPYLVTPSLLKRRSQETYRSQTVWLQSPEDILLSKAIMQRDPSHGKHDFEDIQNFAKVFPLDRQYFKQRVKELNATERVGTLLDSLI